MVKVCIDEKEYEKIKQDLKELEDIRKVTTPVGLRIIVLKGLKRIEAEFDAIRNDFDGEDILNLTCAFEKLLDINMNIENK